MQNSYMQVCEKTFFEDGIEYRYELGICYKSIGNGESIPLYAISVEMIMNGIKTFYKTDGLFADVRKAYRFFDKISENLATPINMPYIIEDELS